MVWSILQSAWGRRLILAADIETLKPLDDPNELSGECAFSEQTAWPIKACLLLRLGKAKLAERVWSNAIVGLNTDMSDPYLSLAIAWAWARFDRMDSAKRRMDDRLALLDARD